MQSLSSGWNELFVHVCNDTLRLYLCQPVRWPNKKEELGRTPWPRAVSMVKEPWLGFPQVRSLELTSSGSCFSFPEVVVSNQFQKWELTLVSSTTTV